MKKNIIYTIIIAVGILLLSGCGSNSRKDSVPPTPPPPTGGYAFANFTSELNIEEYKIYNIEFQLTQGGLAVPGASVFMKVADKSIGSIEDYTVETNENGEGAFVYTPPAIFPEKGELFVVFTDGNITLEETVKLNFNLKTDIPTDGRATTLSISYEGSECIKERGIVGHYHVHAVDRFSRLPIVNIPVRISLINGIEIINNEKVQIRKGSINNYDPIEFYDSSVNFATQTNLKNGDNLIIFPSQGRTDASYIGGWDIASVGESLTFRNYYNNLVTETSLTYIVGNEERFFGGEYGEGGESAVAHVEQNDITDENGYVNFNIVSDFTLAGHTVSVEAHGNEDGNRIGVAQKIFIRLPGDDFSASEVTVPNDHNTTRKVTMHLTINPECTGNQWLMETPVNPKSFNAEPTEHCKIVVAETERSTNEKGNIKVAVKTDGNETAALQCTISWNGGPGSLMFEY